MAQPEATRAAGSRAHGHHRAAAGGQPAFSTRRWPGQGPCAGHGHGRGLLRGPRSAPPAYRAALASPVPTPAEKAGRAQVTVVSAVCPETGRHLIFILVWSVFVHAVTVCTLVVYFSEAWKPTEILEAEHSDNADVCVLRTRLHMKLTVSEGCL